MSQPSKRRRSGRNKKSSKEPPPRTHSLDDILQHSGDEALADENDTSTNSSQTELSGEEAPLAKRSKSDSNSTAVSPELETTKHKVLPELTSITTQNLLPHSPPLSSPTQYSYNINPPPVGRPVRIYCDGIFDLFHFGHARMLEQAKKAYPDVYLIVGVCDDQVTHTKKGKTVMSDSERAQSLMHCKWVDQVIEHAPWVIDQEFLEEHRIDYVAHDDIPYASSDSSDVYAFVKEQGKFLPTQRTEGVSTSDLITRIVRDYDQYVRRNLERGMTAKELNLGFLKEQEINVKKSISDIRSSIHQNWHGTKTELKNDLRQTFAIWEERSQEFVRGFSGRFGAEYVVDKLFRRTRRTTNPDETGNNRDNADNKDNAEETSNNNNTTASSGRHRSKSFDFLRRDSS